MKTSRKLKPLEKTFHARPLDVRLMGVDFGLKRIGLAVCSPDHTMASPACTIKRTNFRNDIAELLTIIEDYEVRGLIFGWPLNMDGTEGPMCDRIGSFADELSKVQSFQKKIDWMATFDERLSTQSVEEFLVKDVDMSRTKRKKVVDKLAAQKILQSALERIEILEKAKKS